MKNILFNLGLAVLCTHELDAVTQSEWRLLYILRDLPDHIASSAFVSVHIPLFAIVFGLVFNEKFNIREWSRVVFSIFLIIHAGLHKSLENNPLYTFYSPLSQGLIFGGGLLGAIYLVAAYISQKAENRKPSTSQL